MKKNKKRWLFLTSSLGQEEFVLAAERLSRQVESLYLNLDVKIFLIQDLQAHYPEYKKYFSSDDLEQENGFGYFFWKPLIAQLSVQGTWGVYDGIYYLDSGCEITARYFSRRKTKYFMNLAMRNNVVVFHSNTPEIVNTKRRVFEAFPSVNPEDTTPQIQAGSWFVSSTGAERMFSQWNQLWQQDRSLIDNSLSINEHRHFVSPRHDQSIFSLLCKSFGVTAEDSIPPGDLTRIRTQIRSFFFPFSWARNRSGETKLSFWISLVGKITLFPFRIGRLIR